MLFIFFVACVFDTDTNITSIAERCRCVASACGKLKFPSSSSHATGKATGTGKASLESMALARVPYLYKACAAQLLLWKVWKLSSKFELSDCSQEQEIFHGMVSYIVCFASKQYIREVPTKHGQTRPPEGTRYLLPLTDRQTWSPRGQMHLGLSDFLIGFTSTDS